MSSGVLPETMKPVSWKYGLKTESFVQPSRAARVKFANATLFGSALGPAFDISTGIGPPIET